MGTLYSGVGLISGLDIDGLVDRLIAAEGRPRDLLVARVRTIDAQRAAYADVSARISALLAGVTSLSARSFFSAVKSTSSNASVLGATATTAAAVGSYSFVVRQLATRQQIVSGGVHAPDASLAAGVLTLESGLARINRSTTLAELNGFRGVQRGAFVIVDGGGRSAEISTVDAATLSDVLGRVNAAGLNVEARLNGDRIELVEKSGGSVTVREVGGGRVAEDLGFGTGNRSAIGTLTGTDVVRLGEGTLLEALRDGNGIRRAKAGGDFVVRSGGREFTVDLSGNLQLETRLARLNHGNGVSLGRIRVTTSDGAAHEVDLSSAATVGEVKSAIEAAASGVVVTLSGSRLIVSYSSEPDGKSLKIEDVDGSTARDLGLAGSSAAGKLTGAAVLSVETAGDLLAAINHAAGNDGALLASLGAKGVVLTGASEFSLEARGESAALQDLGFAAGRYTGGEAIRGARLVGGLDTALLSTLNGGRGYELGEIELTTRGSVARIDLSGAETLQDVIDRLNAVATSESMGFSAAVDARGTRLVIAADGEPPAEITIRDVKGNFAEKSGLAGSGTTLRSANLQRQYVSTNTRLESLNNGVGVARGRFTITDSQGVARTIDITPSSIATVGDVVERINAENFGVSARINDTGDGILLTDTAGGTLALKVADAGGTAARDLNILGESSAGQIDGSYEQHISVSGATTLNDLMRQINAGSTLATAAILKDGSGLTPYRLAISSKVTGVAGELIVEGGGGLDFSTLTHAQDAKVLVGDDAAGGLLVTGSSNTLADVFPGLTLQLAGVDEKPVSITVSRDDAGLITSMNNLVSAFNAVVDRINELDSFDADTEQRGALFADGAIRTVESRLARMFAGSLSGAGGAITRYSQVGITLKDGKMSLDESKLRKALEENRDAVTEFFTNVEHGAAASLKEKLEDITEIGGVINRRDKALDRQKELINERITALNELLDRKRDRLRRQFLSMEESLAQLQAQQASLASLGGLVGSASLLQRR